MKSYAEPGTPYHVGGEEIDLAEDQDLSDVECYDAPIDTPCPRRPGRKIQRSPAMDKENTPVKGPLRKDVLWSMKKKLVSKFSKTYSKQKPLGDRQNSLPDSAIEDHIVSDISDGESPQVIAAQKKTKRQNTGKKRQASQRKKKGPTKSTTAIMKSTGQKKVHIFNLCRIRLKLPTV